MLILIVEDHEDSRRATHTLLGLQGHIVSAVADGEGALALLDERLAAGEPSFDLALIDLNLPGMSGTELLTHLRRRCSMRCFALSGMTAPSDVEAALRAGFDLHLAKPISFDELDRALLRVEPRKNSTHQG